MGIWQRDMVARINYNCNVDIAMPTLAVSISHWLPIVTFCPVNKLPDVIYITVYLDSFAELYEVRRRIRRFAMWKIVFMEELAEGLFCELYDLDVNSVEVKLFTGRHIVRISK